MSESRRTIDSTLGIQVDQTKYNNEINTLLQLRIGLLSLYNSLRSAEIHICNERPGKRVTFIGGNPFFSDETMDLFACYFHWYGTTICNYARLTGLIVSQENGSLNLTREYTSKERVQLRDSCSAYVKSIPELEEIVKWRNKISGHFALTDPRPDDNPATLEASIIFPIGFQNDRFRTATYVSSMAGFDSEVPIWSLTETFENLSARFWPDIQFSQ